MLTIEHLTKHYPGTSSGVTDLSLHVEKGDLFAFIGHNGAGKTTTLKSVVGIHNFDQGEIRIDGISLKEKPIACKQKLAYIPDNPELYAYLTGAQYLTFVADIFGVPADLRQERTAQYGKQLGILDALGF